MNSPSLPLVGLTIVEATSVDAPVALALAAGLCGRMAADLGASVVRIQPRGEPASAESLFLHSGKRRLVVSPGSLPDLAGELAGSADALVTDHALHARLAGRTGKALPVLIAMSRDAPDTGSEFMIEARSGLLDLVGDPDRSPLRLGGHQISYSAGLSAFLGLVNALSRRGAGLAAGPVRTDLLDIAVWLNWKTLSTAERTGRSPSRPGQRAEWNLARCADGHVALVYRVQEWPALKAATGDPRLEDERFQMPASRRLHREALNTVLADVFRTKTRADIRAMAMAFKLPLGMVKTPAELVMDPHFCARDFFHAVRIAGEDVLMPTLPVKWNGRTLKPAIAETDIAGAAR